MAKLYDVVSAGGEYTDRNGNTKVRWINHGAVFEKNGKLSMKLDSVAIAGDGWYKLFDAKDGARRDQGPAQNKQPDDDFGDKDLPF